MKEYRITIDETTDGIDIQFWDGDKTTGPLAIGELLECVLSVMYKPTGYPMMTLSQWKERAYKIYKKPLGAESEKKEENHARQSAGDQPSQS